MPKPRTIVGQILYTSEMPDRAGQERGREFFTLTHHDDGSRTLTSHAEIDDAPNVVRDVSQTVGKDWYPMDSSVRITVGGAFTGSGWFRFGDGFAECETHTAAEGRISQRLATDGHMRLFGNHAIANDGWITNAYDLSKGPGLQQFPLVLLSSPDHRGATGPLIFGMGQGLRFIGHETLTVRAGTFEALHFQIECYGMPKEHPPYDLWVTPGDYIFLKGRVTGYMQTYYELVRLDRSA
jgi:hypothetical protein